MSPYFYKRVEKWNQWFNKNRTSCRLYFYFQYRRVWMPVHLSLLVVVVWCYLGEIRVLFDVVVPHLPGWELGGWSRHDIGLLTLPAAPLAPPYLGSSSTWHLPPPYSPVRGQSNRHQGADSYSKVLFDHFSCQKPRKVVTPNKCIHIHTSFCGNGKVKHLSSTLNVMYKVKLS